MIVILMLLFRNEGGMQDDCALDAAIQTLRWYVR